MDAQGASAAWGPVDAQGASAVWGPVDAQGASAAWGPGTVGVAVALPVAHLVALPVALHLLWGPVVARTPWV